MKILVFNERNNNGKSNNYKKIRQKFNGPDGSFLEVRSNDNKKNLHTYQHSDLRGIKSTSEKIY